MAGIGADAVQPLNINPNQYLGQAVQPMESVVNPSAIAALSEAFRSGQVSADDIISRYGEVAKNKDKATIQGLHEFISPEAIQARKNTTQAANVDAILKSSPEYQAAQEATFLDIKNKAEAGDHTAMRQTMLAKGWPAPSFDPKVGWTPEVRKATEEAFQEFANYFDNIAAAKAFVDDAESAPIKSSKTVIENGNEKTTVTETARHISKSTGQLVDEKLLGKARASASQTPNMWRHMGKPQFLEVFGVKPGKFGGGVSGPLEEPTIDTTVDTFPAIGVTPKAAAPAPEKPSIAPTGEIVTSVTEKPVKEPPASEITEKEKLYAQISSADEFKTKMDRARSLINDAVIKPVGPGYSEGSRTSEFLNGLGAFLGIDSATLKNQTQDQLKQFLAQHVQATIRSMAGTGNRVMQAEIRNDPGSLGLFYQAAPTLSSTPETWNTWLSDLETLFQNARDGAVAGLPQDERTKYTGPLGSTGGAAKTPAAARGFRPTTGAAPELNLKGGLKLKLDPATNTYK